VGAYLRALHMAARGALEVPDAFACCSDRGAVTLPPVDLGAETRCLPAFQPMDAPRASDTIAVSGAEALLELGSLSETSAVRQLGRGGNGFHKDT